MHRLLIISANVDEIHANFTAGSRR